MHKCKRLKNNHCYYEFSYKPLEIKESYNNSHVGMKDLFPRNLFGKRNPSPYYQNISEVLGMHGRKKKDSQILSIQMVTSTE